MVTFRYFLVLILLYGVMAKECSIGINNEMIKNVNYTIRDTKNQLYGLHSFEFDVLGANFFFLSSFPFSSKHLLTKSNILGATVWSRSLNYKAVYNTLEYSTNYSTLYYTMHKDLDSFILAKVDSEIGHYLESYHISGFYQSWYYHACSLAKDEMVYYCNMHKTSGELGILRYNRKDSQIGITIISNSPQNNYHGNSILAIDDKEVLYGYRTASPDKHHLIRAMFKEPLSSNSEYSFVERSHQSILADTFRSGIAVKLDEKAETVWHALVINHNLAYFQVNLTDSSLVGAKHASNTSEWLESRALGIDIHQDAIWIWRGGYKGSLVVVNAKNQSVIQAYFYNSPSYIHSTLVKGDYLSFIGCISEVAYNCSHHQISLRFGFDNIYTLKIDSSFGYSKTQGFEIVQETVTNHNVNTHNSKIFKHFDISDELDLKIGSRYIIVLPESLNFVGTYRPGNLIQRTVPCAPDTRDAVPLECEGIKATPKWFAVNCDQPLVEIRQPSTRLTTTEKFEIKSKYQDIEITTRYNITVIPCKGPNCRFCFEHECDHCEDPHYLNKKEHYCYLKIKGKHIPISLPAFKLTEETGIALQAAGLGIIIGFLAAFLSGTSAQDAWSIIHFLQIVIFLPLMITDMDVRFKDFIVANAIFALSSYSLPVKSVESLFIGKLAFDQPDEYLKDLGWLSGSTLVNSILLIMFVIFCSIVIITLKLIVQLLYRSRSNKTSMFNRISLKISRLSPLAIFVRIMFETYMITCLMAISELKYYFINGGKNNFGYQEEEEGKVRGNYISSFISFCIIILAFALLLFTYFLFKKNNENMDGFDNLRIFKFSKTMKKIPNLYISCKDDDPNLDNAQDPLQKVKTYRLYSFLFLARRMIMILVLVLIPNYNIFIVIKVLCLLALQAAYTKYAISVRSFACKKDQNLEAYNEVMILVLMILCVLHFYVNESIFISLNMLTKIFLAHLIILFLVSFISSIIKLCKYTSTTIIKLVKFVRAPRNGPGGQIRLEDDLGSHEPVENLSMADESSQLDDHMNQNKPGSGEDLRGTHIEDDQEINEESKAESVE